MTVTTEPSVEETSGKGRRSLLLGLVLAIVGAGFGYFAVISGYIPRGDTTTELHGVEEAGALERVAFVPLEPITVSLTRERQVQHLRFRAELEVAADARSEVEHIVPRIMDVLNSYLRALELEDLNDSAALTRLRGQMLRRVQIVAGPDRIRDILVMEFVLN